MEYFVLDGKEIDLKAMEYPNRKIGVIVHIYDEQGNIMLQQRGPKSRDENGLYEDVGGKFEESDSDYKTAIVREMIEEMGADIQIELSDAVGVYHCFKNNINWVFIIFLGKYISGEAKLMEPGKCLGYRFFSYEKAINSQKVSESSKYLIRKIKQFHGC